MRPRWNRHFSPRKQHVFLDGRVTSEAWNRPKGPDLEFLVFLWHERCFFSTWWISEIYILDFLLQTSIRNQVYKGWSLAGSCVTMVARDLVLSFLIHVFQSEMRCGSDLADL